MTLKLEAITLLLSSRPREYLLVGTLFTLFEFMPGERVGAGELWGALPRASGRGAGGQGGSPVSGRDRRGLVTGRPLLH